MYVRSVPYKEGKKSIDCLLPNVNMSCTDTFSLALVKCKAIFNRPIFNIYGDTDTQYEIVICGNNLSSIEASLMQKSKSSLLNVLINYYLWVIPSLQKVFNVFMTFFQQRRDVQFRFRYLQKMVSQAQGLKLMTCEKSFVTAYSNVLYCFVYNSRICCFNLVYIYLCKYYWRFLLMSIINYYYLLSIGYRAISFRKGNK